MNADIIKRLEKKAKIKQLEGTDATTLVLEVNKEYAKVMNGIIFDKYLKESSSDLLPHNLVLPNTSPAEVPYYGLLELE